MDRRQSKAVVRRGCALASGARLRSPPVAEVRLTLAPRLRSILDAFSSKLCSRRRRRIDEILAPAYAGHVKSMIRLPAFILVGCVVCAGLIPIEFGSVSSHRPIPEARLPSAEVEPAAPEIRKLAKETPSSANDADSPLRDVRLTGVVIGSDLRMAIFAVTGTSSRVLSEGETLNGWRLESISPKVVMLSGRAGKIVLKPQPDANLVRSPPPVAVPSDQLDPPMAGAAGQPVAVTPITVINL